jgi:hypothetical protein
MSYADRTSIAKLKGQRKNHAASACPESGVWSTTREFDTQNSQDGQKTRAGREREGGRFSCTNGKQVRIVEPNLSVVAFKNRTTSSSVSSTKWCGFFVFSRRRQINLPMKFL